MDEESNTPPPAFVKPSRALQEPTAHLYVANCGPAVGISFSEIKEAFQGFGPVLRVHPAGDNGSRVYVSYANESDAVAAREAWNSKPCDALRNRVMVIQHAVPQSQPAVGGHLPVCMSSADCGIPGLILYMDFVSPAEEQDLLHGVDERPWQTLAKRRVQHYGYEFLYKIRNVDLSQKLGELPSAVQPVLRKISTIPEIATAEEPSLPLDQLTVNEYPRGVGLSPHIDTHSAFEGSILSLSLAGPCIMEFRRYGQRCDVTTSGSSDNLPLQTSLLQGMDEAFCEESDGPAEEADIQKGGQPKNSVEMERRALFLPQRSLLVLSREARYAWHHYIPHHKIDNINGQIVDRGTRRVSFTFRKCHDMADFLIVKHYVLIAHPVFGQLCLTGLMIWYFVINSHKVRSGPCLCKFSEYCDSHLAKLENPIQRNLSCDSIDYEVRDSTLYEEMDINDESPSVSSENLEVDEPALTIEGLPKGFNAAIPEIEKKYVHKVYDAIAPHFSATRFAKWPRVALFLESLSHGSIVADAGCGNGKYLGFNPNCFFIGCDISPPLIAICAQQGHEVLVADALHLPYRTGFCDAGISIAVLHHLSNEDRRIRAIDELLRVVRRKGKVLFTVWAVEQEDKKLLTKWTPLTCKYMEEWVDDIGTDFKRSMSTSSLGSIKEGEGRGASDVLNTGNISEDLVTGMIQSTPNQGLNQPTEEEALLDVYEAKGGEQQEYFVPWHLPYHRAEIGGASAAALASGLARKDDSKRALVYNRYYHCFVEGELERLASQVQGARIIDHFYDKSNWCIVMEKL